MSSLAISYVHRGGETPLIGVPIHAWLEDAALRHPHDDALVSIPQEVRWSHAELQAEVDRLARGLVHLGLERGDRVGVWSPNNVEWVLLQLATARIGAVLVNVNPGFRAAAVTHALETARVDTLFLAPSFRSSHYAETMRELCPEVETCEPGSLGSERLPELRRLVVFDPDRPEAVERPARGFFTWPEVLAGGERVSPEEIASRGAALEAGDAINIQFTSGTTGAPKAAVLTHHNILNNGYFIGQRLGLTPDDHVCIPVPFCHCFGMVVGNLACLAHGAAIVIPAPHFDAEATLSAIERERCTAVHGVPTMFVGMLEAAAARSFDLSSLRTGIMAGAPCPPELMRRVIEDLGCRDIRIGYGQTEASPVTHLTRAEDTFEQRVGTVGTNLPHQEVKVVDPATGATVPIGERGEVCFRGYHVMRGYFENEEATRKTIDPAGWLRSGDIGVLDADGYLQIVGRLKDLIIRGGENIDPAEIEAHYFTHPAVAQIAVFGIRDERLGEDVAAWVQLHEGAEVSEEELREFGRATLAHFKVPHYLRIVDEMPMTTSGKIQKFRIREQVEGELSARST